MKSRHREKIQTYSGRAIALNNVFDRNWRPKERDKREVRLKNVHELITSHNQMPYRA